MRRSLNLRSCPDWRFRLCVGPEVVVTNLPCMAFVIRIDKLDGFSISDPWIEGRLDGG